MEEKKSKSTNFTWPSAAVLATLLATLLHNSPPLQSSRPNEKLSGEHTARGDQTVEARLWQDPFAAVANFKKKPGAVPQKSEDEDGLCEPNTLCEVVNQIRRRTSPNPPRPAANVTVYFVMVSNGPYVEDAERRMRTRYAVVSALGISGYVPGDEEHIGYFEINWPRGAVYQWLARDATPILSALQHVAGDDLLIPFEWFQPDTLRPMELDEPSEATGAILLVWLDANAFGDYPGRRLAQLMGDLRRSGSDPILDTNQLRFKLLDPRLHDILNEPLQTAATTTICTACPSVSVTRDLGGLPIYSSWSTTADALLVSTLGKERRDAVATNLSTRGFRLINATATDDEMTARLVQELADRGVDLADMNTHVALVSESDTFYGRALPLTFAANALCRYNTNDFPAVVRSLKTDQRSWPTNIHLSTYLRGVDGRLPGEAAPKPEAGKANDKSKTMEFLERPEGPSQLDYMPRLARALHYQEAEFKRSGGAGFKAIGILGTDVYDKLLLLQSLHNLFPAAIFFTTDRKTSCAR